jgi:hypothetical protein
MEQKATDVGFPNWEQIWLPLRAGVEDACSHHHREMGKWLLLLPAAAADAESALRVAAAGIQAVGAEVVPAFIAAHQALAENALFAVVTDRDVAAFDEVQFTPVDQGSFAGEVQGDHGNSIEAWKLLPVAST